MQLVARHYETAAPVRISTGGGCITAIEPAGDVESDQPLPWVAPGLVDIQVNGYAGDEFSSARLTTESVVRIIERFGEFGVTRLCPTLTTEGFDVLAHGLRTIARACESDAQTAARVLGIHVEGPYISPEDGPRGAHPRSHCRPPDWNEFQRLQEAAAGRIRLLTLSPEYDEAPRFIERVVQSGVVVAIGHTAADSSQIRAAVDAGATLSTHLGNGAHTQLRRHPNYLWDQLAEDRLTASLIVDGHHLPPEVVKTFVRAKTPQRCILVSDVGSLAGCPPGRYKSALVDLEVLEDGRLVIAGQRQLLAGASRPIGVGIAGVMRYAGVDLPTAVHMASLWPARLLGMPADGLTVGAPADLILFDQEPDSRTRAKETGVDLHDAFAIRLTLAGGREVYPCHSSSSPRKAVALDVPSSVGRVDRAKRRVDP